MNALGGAPRVPALRRVNALTVDVEDYFQVQSLSSAYNRSTWDACEGRVERNVDRLLELFDHGAARATFFTLGWIAERHKPMMRRIASAGHEIASHGYCHERVDRQSPVLFREDVRRTKAILEGCTGTPVRGYRAATFSIGPTTQWAFRILEEEGHAYSSSVHPVRHDNYSFPEAPRFAYRPAGTFRFWEIPITTVRLAGHNFACGGGGYFRLFPYLLSRAALAHVNLSDNQPIVFYLHPWEIDPDQPRPAGVPLKSRLRHYLNLAQTEPRLVRLLRDFSWSRIDRVFTELSAPELARRAQNA